MNSVNALMLPIFSAIDFQMTCQPSSKEAMSAPAFAGPGSPSSKSSAILGGEMSALDRIKAQQSAVIQHETASLTTPNLQHKMKPAAAGIRIATEHCTPMSSTPDRLEPEAPFAIPDSEDFLGSKRVSISKTGFDREWQRVRTDAVSASDLGFATSKSSIDLDTIQAVNRWVNRTIDYVEDRDLFGRADYWAGASMTVLLGKGDCEDIALTKLQMLAAAGFDRKDMFLTIARDTVRRADHALLVVRIKDRFVVLDNATDELLDGASSHGYSPVLSFADKKRWVHGYEAKP